MTDNKQPEPTRKPERQTHPSQTEQQHNTNEQSPKQEKTEQFQNYSTHRLLNEAKNFSAKKIEYDDDDE